MSVSWRLIYAVDALAVLSFFTSYFLSCYRKGYRIDIWHTVLFLTCVLPNFVMLPFAINPLNVLILGNDYIGAVSATPFVYFVALAGYCSFLVGGTLWNLRLGVGLRRTATRVLNIIPKWSLMMMSSRSLLLYLSCVGLLLEASLLVPYFIKNGFGFDLRSYTFAHPELRPIALLTSNWAVLIASHCIARWIEKKENVLLFCAASLTVGLMFFGARANIIFIFLNVALCYFVRLKRSISLTKLALLLPALLMFLLYLGSAREGNFGVSEFLASLAMIIFFGNTFSDLRDFAWVYSDWNHTFWLGKSYLAAITSFIPRVASSFRDTWSLGAATATIAGFDPQIHPGLRPGAFGESYFNFGIPGVILMGLVLGLLTRRVDTDTKLCFLGSRNSMMKAFASTSLLGVMGAISVSAGFSGFYTTILLYLFSGMLLRMLTLWRL